MNPYEYPELTMMDGMTDQQRAIFLSQYNAVRKDEVVGVVLAVLLGHFGVHRFYLGEYGWGVLYLLFCWTFIPTVLGVIEAFFMPGRVREFNLVQASVLAMRVRQTPIYSNPGSHTGPSSTGLAAV